MPARELTVVIDASDVEALRSFWVAAMGYVPQDASGPYRSAVPPDGETGPKLLFQQVPEAAETHKNRIHLDIVVGDEIADEADRLDALGAARLTDLVEEDGVTWMVMADPEGNEFCLVEHA